MEYVLLCTYMHLYSMCVYSCMYSICFCMLVHWCYCTVHGVIEQKWNMYVQCVRTFICTVHVESSETVGYLSAFLLR